MKVFFSVLFVITLSFVFPVVNANAQAAGAESFKATTVYLVRHAERSNEPPRDPALSEAGRARAQMLAKMLEKSGVKAILTSQFLRSTQTAEPLSKLLGVAVTPQTMTISPSNPREVSDESLKQVVDKIYENAGGAVLVVGHTNTVPQIIKMLGADAVPEIDEQRYDDLFIVTVYEKGKSKLAHLKF